VQVRVEGIDVVGALSRISSSPSADNGCPRRDPFNATNTRSVSTPSGRSSCSSPPRASKNRFATGTTRCCPPSPFGDEHPPVGDLHVNEQPQWHRWSPWVAKGFEELSDVVSLWNEIWHHETGKSTRCDAGARQRPRIVGAPGRIRTCDARLRSPA